MPPAFAASAVAGALPWAGAARPRASSARSGERVSGGACRRRYERPRPPRTGPGTPRRGSQVPSSEAPERHPRGRRPPVALLVPEPPRLEESSRCAHQPAPVARRPASRARWRPRRCSRRVASAQAPEDQLRATLAAQMAQAPGASGLHVVDLTDGHLVFDDRGREKRLSASVNKLYTTATALLELGPRARGADPVLATGRRAGSTWQGDLYLRGGGDFTFGTAAFARKAYGSHATVEGLAADLRRCGAAARSTAACSATRRTSATTAGRRSSSCSARTRCSGAAARTASAGRVRAADAERAADADRDGSRAARRRRRCPAEAAVAVRRPCLDARAARRRDRRRPAAPARP